MVRDQGSEKTANPKVEQQPSLTRTSLDSTATTLPSYSQQSDQPPRYTGSASSGQLGHGQGSKTRKAQTSQSNGANTPNGVSAAALNAIMATSSSEHDKMHSGRRSKKVDDWNEDHTYKGKLASRSGSSSKWNYFGVDIEQFGNPFKRSGKK